VAEPGTDHQRQRKKKPSMYMRRVALRALAPSAVAAVGCYKMAGCSAPEPPVDLVAAQKLRSVAMRARDSLTDPPAALRRCARSAWRTHASDDSVAYLSAKQDALREQFSKTASAWKTNGRVDDSELARLEVAVSEAESAVQSVRASAVRGAASLSWHEAVGGTELERADGATGGASMDKLGGQIVGLYFTASWCPPCRRFSPRLVELYEAARARFAARSARGAQPFEVVLVSWDEMADERDEYARSSKMSWLALPHARRDLADELTLRYDVRIPPPTASPHPASSHVRALAHNI
jgi:thiol-disulfide isomerase/thioredoxin